MYIKNLILRNFKSFKNTTVRFEPGFNALVGPNGSGKSNIIDAVQFGFGESRIRSLRAKKTRDLIFGSSRIGEVEIELVDEAEGGRHVVSRAIRNDGKIKYKLDSKVAKKYVIEDFLASNRLGSHNIIQQGQVQQIVEMSPKDRRGLIDIIANVAEYEEKKREAIGKLNAVQLKLSEASAILAEREGYMNELKAEKEEAEAYLKLKKELDGVAATLLYLNAREIESEFDSLVRSMLESTGKMDNLVGEISLLEQEISKAQERKQAINDEILKRSEGRQVELQKVIDGLNSKITIAKAVISDKKDFIAKSGEKERTVSMDCTRAQDELRGVSGQTRELETELAASGRLLSEEQLRYEKMLSDSTTFSEQFYSAKKAMEEAGAEMLATKEKLNLVQAEASMIREKQRLKQDELERLKAGRTEDYSDKRRNLAEAEREQKRAIAKLEGELDALFLQEKEYNERLPVLDDLILLSKERMIEFQSRLRHVGEGTESRAVEAVLALKKAEPEIYGTVDQLCKYETELTLPVQVALGQRTHYVIVESSGTATRAIEHLKKEGLGRVSFIPLDKIHSAPLTGSDRELASREPSRGFLIDSLEFDPQFRKAFEYVCGSTVLVSTLSEAKSLVGKIRFVSMEGDLGESSGLLTGGKTTAKINVIKEQAGLEENSRKNADAKSEKETLIRSLQAISLQMHELRKKKAEAELRQRAIKLELDDLEHKEREQDERSSNLKAAVRKLEEEVSDADGQASKKDSERSELIRRLSEQNLSLLENKQKVDIEKEQNYGVMLKEKERRISDLKITLSDYSNRLSALSSKKAVYEKQLSDYERQRKELMGEHEQAKKAMADAEELLAISRAELEKRLIEQKEIAGALKGLFDELDGLEKEVQKTGNKKGKLEFEKERLTVGLQDRQIKKAVVETKLSDLNAQLAAMGEIQIIEGAQKPTIESRKKELEPKVAELSGRVNLRAVEIFSQRQAEFEGQKKHVVQLQNEKESVFAMITEIEGRKISTFMSAFDFVNDNFNRLFSQIFKGRGSLVLENRQNPFEGGLTIEVALDDKEVKYLELMSGGEKSLIALIFLFALQAYNPSSVYILDEADGALDAENSRKLALLVGELSKKSQFLLISHNQTVYKAAQCLVGVMMTKDGSKLVEVKLHEQGAAVAAS